MAIVELQRAFERPPSPLLKPSPAPKPKPNARLSTLRRSTSDDDVAFTSSASASATSHLQPRKKQRKATPLTEEDLDAFDRQLQHPDSFHGQDSADFFSGVGGVHEDQEGHGDDRKEDEDEEVIPILSTVAQSRALGATSGAAAAIRGSSPPLGGVPRSSLSAMLMKRPSAGVSFVPTISFSAPPKEPPRSSRPPSSPSSSEGVAVSVVDSHSQSYRNSTAQVMDSATAVVALATSSSSSHQRNKPTAQLVSSSSTTAPASADVSAKRDPSIATVKHLSPPVPITPPASQQKRADPAPSSSPIIHSVFAAAAAAAAGLSAAVPAATGIFSPCGSSAQGNSSNVNIMTPAQIQQAASSFHRPDDSHQASSSTNFPSSSSSSGSRRRRRSPEESLFRVPKTALPMLSLACAQQPPDWDHEKTCYLCGLGGSRLCVRSNAASPRVFPLAMSERMLLKRAGIFVGPFTVDPGDPAAGKRSVHLLCALWAARPDPSVVRTLDQAQEMLGQRGAAQGSPAAEIRQRVVDAIAGCRDAKCSFCGKPRASVPCIREKCGNRELWCAISL